MRFALQPALGVALALGLPATADAGALLAPAPRVERVRPGASLGPGASDPSSAGLVIDTQSRNAVIAAWQQVFEPAFLPPIDWTGDLASCKAGTTNDAHAEATIALVNWFRAMSGLPGNITRARAHEREAQDAALMMIAQGDLSHDPQPPWACWTAEGATGANNSLIAVGVEGPMAVFAYVEDAGDGNEDVGHRRWLLYPPQQTMDTGSTDAVYDDGYWRFDGSNALWVFDPPGAPSAPPVAWPPAGFVPYPVVFPRWSFGLDGADFSKARVSMQLAGSDVPVTLLPLQPGPGDPWMIGDPTLVFEPSLPPFGPGMSDQTVTVTVTGILGVPGTTDVSWQVTVIDADRDDADGDGVVDAQDNCPFAANPAQTDRGGLGAGSASDGIGDACQCGDVNGDGRVTISDATMILRSLLTPPTVTLPVAERCDVGGSTGCSTGDAVRVIRALLTPPRAGLQAVCAPALPVP